MRLPHIIQVELDKIPGRWRIENGTRHKHVVIDDRLVGILPRKGGDEGNQRGYLNIRAQIRRTIEGRT